MADDANFLGRGWSFPPAFTPGGAEVLTVSGEDDIEQSLGLLLVTIDYTVRATNSRYNLVYPFYLREATGES